MRARALLAAAAVALIAPAAGQAAAPVDLGAGTQPRVAVDAEGAAHLTFTERAGGQDTTRYCKLPVGAVACSSPNSFAYPSGPETGTSSGAWPLLPGDGRVLVVDARCCTNYSKKFVYTSTNGGASFDGGTEVGDDNNSGAGIQGGALFAPAGALGRPAESILTFTDLATLGLSFQASGTTGPPAATNSNDVLTQGDAQSGSIGLGGNSLLAAWSSIDDGFVYWRLWSGFGDVNDSSTWGPITQLEASGINAAPRLAAGPGGVDIAYNAGTSGPQQTVVRQFSGTEWGPSLVVGERGNPRFDLAQDQLGTLHFVYQQDGALMYRFGTTTENKSFSAPQALVPGTTAAGFPNLRIALGPDNGWATWEQDGHVMALRFTPSALVPPTPGSTVNAVPTKGKVLVKLPPAIGAGAGKASGFVPLESLGRQIPVGSTLDTSRGTVRLFSATNNSGGTQSGDFSKGLFNISQGRKNPLTTLSMTGGGLSACGKLPPGGSPKALATSAKRKRRSLFTTAHGHFSVRGRNSAATVRGTSFTVTDACNGTLTQVKTGTVSVRDFWLRKTRKVRAGRSYLARRGNR